MELINFDVKRLLIVPIEEIRPNTWNPKIKDTKEYEKVKEGIRLNGLKESIKVRENQGENLIDKYEIIDGEQRYTACKDLGYKKVLIYNEGIVDDKKARELTLWWQTQVPIEELKLAEMVKDMTLAYGKIDIPYTKEEIDELIKLSDFNWDMYQKEEDIDINELKTIKLTKEQYEIVLKAINKIKEKENIDISEGRALELICADYIL
jgi:hypothetical protein